MIDISGLTVAQVDAVLARFGNAPAALSPPPVLEDAWKPSGVEYDRSIHHNPDASAWADFFVATFPGQVAQHDLMRGWFANAMMAMHDWLKTQAASPAAPAQPEGVEAVAWAVINHCDNDKVGIAFEKPGAEWFARVGAAYSVRPLVYGDTRPAPAQQAVTDGVEVVRIDRSERLDPITVYLADEGGGRGRMTIVCYNQAWTCYWGAMGNRTLREFVARCDASYVSGNMLSGLVSEDSDFAYARRVAEAVIATLASNAAASAADAQEGAK